MYIYIYIWLLALPDSSSKDWVTSVERLQQHVIANDVSAEKKVAV